jgi:ribosomal protein L37AE/L43A
MPYLHCPRCHRTAWMRSRKSEDAIACHHCGTTLTVVTADETAFLTGAVRERFARDVRRSGARPRFLRDAPPLTE